MGSYKNLRRTMGHCKIQGKWKKNGRNGKILQDLVAINYKATDSVCKTWCNPAPKNGSAPNSVQLAMKLVWHTTSLHLILKHVNNGFELILRRMTIVNFNWFLHAMLFYHTQRVITKINKQNMEYSDQSSASSVSEALDN